MTADQRSQVAHLATYITDDGAIAAYCGVTRDDVIDVRRNVSKAAPRRFLADRNEGSAASSGSDSNIRAATEAEHGSARLLQMMERSFELLAERRRIPFEDARLLLMNAVM